MKIFFHDNCFDGTASAAIFSDFYLKRIDAHAEIHYQGVQHHDGDPFEGLELDADANACLDFRYHERMDWWFDHHVSAFQPPERRAHFEKDESGKKFYDPAALSCTRYMVDTLAEHYGYQAPEHFHELIEWAHVIDSASFASPEIAVSLDQPATRLMTWVRYNRDPVLMHRYIRELKYKTLDALVEESWIQDRLGDLLDQHHRTMDLVRRHAVVDGGVVFVDLADESVLGYNSFIPYFLFPASPYTVGLVCADGHVRISVGYNPWSNITRTHNIAAICERFGGGGHPSVGGVAVPAARLADGRAIAEAIRVQLRLT